MRKLNRRVLIFGTSVVVALVVIPGLGWVSLTHKPDFYRAMVKVPHAQQEAEAKRFVAQSLQLSNDIRNEPTWEAVFTDQQVNAWLAEDLVRHFADQLPSEVHEPRVMFELDRVTLAFEFDQGPVRSVIWVIARPVVPEPNVLELTLEKIRAGVLPIPAEKILDRITQHARNQGLDVTWKRDADLPVAVIRYTPDSGRDDVKLERLQIHKGEIRLAGRSDRSRGAASLPTLPTRKVLQSKFPKRTIQPGAQVEPSASLPSTVEVPTTAARNSTMPLR